jgi:hypothetical protein
MVFNANFNNISVYIMAVRGGLKHFHKERGPIFFREKKSYFETICFKKNKIILRFN